MLWLCISLPQLPLEAVRSEAAQEAVVVTACEGSARWVICCNQTAESVGLTDAMNYTVALAIHPQVRPIERKLQAEQAALTRLAAWAYQFSSTVIPGAVSTDLRRARMSSLWLEIGASLKLFGGFRRFIEHLENELTRLDYTYRLGVGPTLEGAALLARSGIRMAVTTSHALQVRLRSLSVGKLDLPPGVAQELHSAGVRTIGTLLELPRDGIARRFGPGISDFLDRLIGASADPRPTFRLPAEYDTTYEFDFEVRNSEALLFPLRRMLAEFAGFLRSSDTGVQQFRLTLSHRDRPATIMNVGLSFADRDVERFFSLVREQLSRTELIAPAIALGLHADRFAAPTALQSDLFDPALHQTEQLSHTLDRIAARLGDSQVHGLKTAADHRPESAWKKAEYRAEAGKADATPGFPDRPLWLLPEPRPLQISGQPQISAGPERIEAGWWDGSRDVRRDYFVVRTSNGADLWVYQDLADRSWYLHGFWS
jgi:protein ImuB